jgi:hypothetical protein
MGLLFMILPFIGILLLISGAVGLFIINLNYSVGDLIWIQGNLTFGVFTLVGLVITICLMIGGLEQE